MLTRFFLSLFLFSFFFLPLQYTRAQKIDDNFYKGIVLFNSGKFEAAIPLFLSSSSIHDPVLYKYTGLCYYNSGQFKKSLESFIHSDNMLTGSQSFEIARCYASLNMNDSAMKYLEAHLNSKYKLPESTIKLDKAFSSLQDTKLWAALWQKDRYTEEESTLNDALYFLNNEKYEDIIDLLEKFIKSHPSSVKAYILRGKAFSALGNPGKATSDYSKAIMIDPENPEPYMLRSAIYFSNDKFQKSLEDLKKAINLNPYDISLVLKKAFAESHLRELNNALQDLNFYLQYYPSDSSAIKETGNIYFINKDFTNALKYYSKNVDLYPSRPGLILLQADAMLELKDYVNAITNYCQVIDLQPGNGRAFFSRGVAKYDSGDIQGACIDWHNARNLGYMDAYDYLVKFCSDFDKNNNNNDTIK